MGQTADEIKEQIDTQREQLGANLQQLEDKVRGTVDWRQQFDQRPMAGVGLAFGAGFLLSLMLPSGGTGSSSSRSRHDDMSSYRVYDESSSYSSQSPQRFGGSSYQPQQSKQRSPEMNEISETVENIRGAVMGLAATRLRSFLAEAVPGFENEYEQARQKRGASAASRIDQHLSTSPSMSGSHPSGGTTNAMSSMSDTDANRTSHLGTGLSDTTTRP